MARLFAASSRRRKACLIASGVLLVASLVVLADASIRFVSRLFPVVALPQVEFDDGERATVSVNRPDPMYYLSLRVKSIDEPVPELDISVRAPDGQEIETEPTKGYSRIFGHKYRHLRIIRPGDRDSFEVLVTGEPDENGGRADLAIFPDPNRAWSEHVVAVMPEWVIGLVLAGLSLLFLCLAVFWHPRDPLSEVFRDPA